MTRHSYEVALERLAAHLNGIVSRGQLQAIAESVVDAIEAKADANRNEATPQTPSRNEAAERLVMAATMRLPDARLPRNDVEALMDAALHAERLAVVEQIQERIRGMPSVATQHSCWDNHEGPNGSHAGGEPCLDRVLWDGIDRAAVLDEVAGLTGEEQER